METLFIGLDVHKRGVSVATADGVRGGEGRYLGEIETTCDPVGRLLRRLSAKGPRLDFC